MSKMRLEIKNVGPINRADINLGKLNIVGGINGSGKSTATRLLYLFLLASSQDGKRVYHNSLRFELMSIGDFLDEGVLFDSENQEFTYGNFELNKEEYKKLSNIRREVRTCHSRTIESKSEELIQKWLDFIDSIDIESKEFYYDYLNNLQDRLNDLNENYRFYLILKHAFFNEFGYHLDINQYGLGYAHFNENINGSDFNWTLYVGENGFEYNVEDNDFLPLIIGDVIYIDSLSSLDVIQTFGISHHINALYPKLSPPLRIRTKRHEEYSNRYGDIEYEEKINKFLIKIDELIGGVFNINRPSRIYPSGLSFERPSRFKFEKNNQNYSMKNSSSGLKQIGTIQMLLSSNILKENDFLIIDEPEVNLHPEWQIRLAEILVLLVKEFNITIYLNSHSPHFIEAMEVFSVKYDIKDQTCFYMTVPDDDSGKFNFKQLSYSNLDELYDDLGNPYDEIDRVRLQNNMKGL